MKSSIFAFGILFSVLGVAHASNLQRISTCVGEDAELTIQLSRFQDEPENGVITFGAASSRPVDIAYTNAGARAIVTTPSLPTLILPNGTSQIKYLGVVMDCTSEF